MSCFTAIQSLRFRLKRLTRARDRLEMHTCLLLLISHRASRHLTNSCYPPLLSLPLSSLHPPPSISSCFQTPFPFPPTINHPASTSCPAQGTKLSLYLSHLTVSLISLSLSSLCLSHLSASLFSLSLRLSTPPRSRPQRVPSLTPSWDLPTAVMTGLVYALQFLFPSPLMCEGLCVRERECVRACARRP